MKITYYFTVGDALFIVLVVRKQISVTGILSLKRISDGFLAKCLFGRYFNTQKKCVGKRFGFK